MFCLLLCGFWFVVAPLTVWVARATTWLYPPFLVDTVHMLCLSHTALTFSLLHKPPYTLPLPCHRVFTIEANLWISSPFLHWISEGGVGIWKSEVEHVYRINQKYWVQSSRRSKRSKRWKEQLQLRSHWVNDKIIELFKLFCSHCAGL